MRPTTSRSQAARASASTRMWPGCSRSKQPLVKPMRRSCPPPLVEPLVEQRAVEHDLLLGRERRRRQDARAQLGGGHRRGAGLADDDRGRGIGGARRRLEVRPHGEQRRKHGDDRVAGAGHVAHLDREGRHMDRLAALGVEQHAVLAQRHQHRLASDGAGERGRRRRNLAHGSRPHGGWRRRAPCGSA